jgi:phage tail sheath protein FI
MPTYSNPGVYVTESPLVSNVARANNAQAVATFIGTAPRGPLTPTLINSWSSFKSVFGDISIDHEMGYSVYHYFANGGRDAYILRVLRTSGDGSPAVKATSTVAYYPNGTGAASASLLTATASSEGVWGNDLSITTTAGAVSATAAVVPTFNVSVRLSGVEVERWNEVSTDPTNNRYVETVINTYSKYVQVAVSSGITASAEWAISSDIATFASGSDGDPVEASHYVSSLANLDTVEGVLLLNAPGQTSSAVVNALLAKAEERGNSFVIIDPSTSTDVTTIGAGTVGGYTASSYGAVYYPMLKMVDPTKTGPGAIRDTYPGGSIAGIYVRTDFTRSVSKSPAGYAAEVRNALGLTGTLTSADSASLYDNFGVNIFKAVPGAGIVVNGARTLDRTTPGKYITIRRSLNFLKQTLKDSTSFAVFEPNDDRLWTRLNMTASAILSEFWRAGGLKGANASEAFYVICDETNNTALSVNNGEVRMEVGVALQYPAEFVVINISQWTGGSNTASTL